MPSFFFVLRAAYGVITLNVLLLFVAALIVGPSHAKPQLMVLIVGLFFAPYLLGRLIMLWRKMMKKSADQAQAGSKVPPGIMRLNRKLGIPARSPLSISLAVIVLACMAASVVLFRISDGQFTLAVIVPMLASALVASVLRIIVPVVPRAGSDSAAGS